MHARTGAQLLEQLRKTTWLPPYNESALRQIAAEIKELLEPFIRIIDANRAQLQTNPSITAPVVVYYRSIQRNKRCALAYLYNRLNRIVAFRWHAGTGAAARLGDNVSGGERLFLQGYNRLLGQYCDSVNLDLTADVAPPRDLFIEVRVVTDCGKVLTDTGIVDLRPGTAHFLKREYVEHLIRQGALRHIV